MAKKTEASPDIQKNPAKESNKQPRTEEPNDESRLIAAISYVFGVFVAVIIFLLKKEDRYVKFHAAQAIMVDLAVMVLGLGAAVIGIGLAVVLGIATMGIGFFLGFWLVWLVLMVFGLCVLIVRLFLAFQAFSGKRFGIPLIGAHAEKIAMS
ncbi:MAG: hypothetical protein V1861_01625 [Candidatus Micrarchaeota archaeon]